LEAVFPDGTKIKIDPDDDPAQGVCRLADSAGQSLVRPGNGQSRLVVADGPRLIHEPDDIRPDNPPVNPALLNYLEAELVKSGWNIRHLFKLICTSRTYQQSSIPQSDNPKVEALCLLPAAPNGRRGIN
jgi:hypothetical protein